MRTPRFRDTVRGQILAVVLVAVGLWFLLDMKQAYDGAREAAIQSSCRNSLKQLALALLEYESGSGSLPPGTIPNPAIPPQHRLSWVVAIWPHWDHESTPAIDPTIAWDASPNWPLRLVSTPGAGTPAYADQCLTCPGDPARSKPTPPRPLAYIGIAGLGADAAMLPAGHKRAGVFGYDRATRLADIADGPAQTMLLVESARAQAAWSAGGPSSVRGVDPATRPYIGLGRPFGCRAGAGRGYPPDGANVAMADGSVRFVRESVDPKVFEAMATIAGGESVPPE